MGIATLKDVVLLPQGKFNLFSVTKLMKQGWTLNGDKNSLSLQKNGQKLTFDIEIPTPKGMLFAIYMERHGEIAGLTADANVKKKTVQQAHDLLGHCNEDATRKAAKELGWELVPGGMKTCEACAAAKAKQKNVPKESEHRPANNSNERIFLDIATIKSAPDGPKVTKAHWLIMVDAKPDEVFGFL